MIEKYNSIYLGICVQNNDPDYRGRIKVWVPHINLNVYNKWNQLKQDQTFAFPGSPGGENLSQILPELKDALPWAEFASPIMGASTAGYYNARSDTNSVSDAPIIYGQPGTNFSNTLSSTSIDQENKGNKPGALYESHPIRDAFSNTAKINSQNFNQYGDAYRPSMYSNAAKGVFSVPNVGAHIWVFFRDGSPLFPVYFGAAFGQEDLNSIFKTGDGTYPDYPGSYENKDYRAGPTTPDHSIYRNKLVINQRGAAIEIINTTDRESYKVSHFAGGYYELNNKFTTLFNPKNFQLFTLADKYETINGHGNLYIGRNSDNIVQGDHWLKVGNFNVDAHSSWNKLYQTLTGITDPTAIANQLKSLANPLADQEKTMGFGGSSFEFIAKHKVVTVGLTPNTSPAYNTDYLNSTSIVTSISPFIPYGYFAPIKRDIHRYKELFLPDMPGGNYDIFAMNRFKIQSGTGGGTIQTTGNLKLNGGTVNIRGEYVGIGAKDGQVDINSSVTTIGGDTVILKSNIEGQVVVDSTLGVSKNVIIGGGAYIEGELFVNHVTAPIEYQVTENTQIEAYGPVINPGGTPDVIASGWNIIGSDTSGEMQLVIPPLPVAPGGKSTAFTTVSVQIVGGLINLNAVGSGALIIAQPHSHVFKNIPLTLKNKPAVAGVVVPGPNEFNTYAAEKIGISDNTAIGSEARVDGRIPTVGVPPPEIYAVGVEGFPFNQPNGPGSTLAGPSIIPGI